MMMQEVTISKINVSCLGIILGIEIFTCPHILSIPLPTYLSCFLKTQYFLTVPGIFNLL